MTTLAPQTRHVRFTVIGDSAAFGTGDIDLAGNPRGWGYYLSQVFHDSCEYLNFSRPGAKSAEVKEVQLPRALERTPDICAMMVGGNDMLRNGFDPHVLYQNITETCRELMDRGTEIIMVELHDPGEILRVPRLLKRVIRRRVNAVNNVYYQVARELDLILIHTRKIPHVHDISIGILIACILVRADINCSPAKWRAHSRNAVGEWICPNLRRPIITLVRPSSGGSFAMAHLGFSRDR